MKKRKIIKIQLKRVLVGISCASLILYEVALIDNRAYAADSRMTVESELTDENTEIEDSARQEENEEQTGVEETTRESNSTGKERKEEASGEGESEGEETGRNESDNLTEDEDTGEKESAEGNEEKNLEEEESEETGANYVLTASENDIASGVIDEDYGHIEWVIDANGKLTVSGTGDFSISARVDRTPWYHDRNSIKSVEVNVTGMTNAAFMFYRCENMIAINLDNFDTSSVTNMNHMFSHCSRLSGIDLGGLDTGSVMSMNSMFCDCSRLISMDLSGLDISNVEFMGGMFEGCNNLTSIDLTELDTSRVTDMSAMFRDCSSLTSIDLSGLNTGSVKNMSGMFRDCSSLTNINLNVLETKSVVGMDYMFYGCSSLTSIVLTSLNTGSVTDMSWMFYGCSGLTNIDLSGLNTSNVTDMGAMFHSCCNLTSIHMNGLETGSVTDMEWMFYGCSNLTTIYSPCNVVTSCSLPKKNGDIWYCSDGTTVTELPRNLSYSVALGRNYIPTEKTDDTYIDKESKHKYKLFDVSMEWEKAKEYCEGLGGHLVTITSEEEQQFVTAIAEKSKKKNIWLGAEMVSGEFSWITGEKFIYTNWNSGEPNNVNNNQNTIMMYTYTGTNNDGYSIIPGAWNDESKQGRDWSGYTLDDTGFICEWDDKASEEGKKTVAVFTTEKSLSVQTGDSMRLAFALLDPKTGLCDNEWKKMSVVVSDKSIIGLSDYEKTEYGYLLKVMGKKEGSTNVVISDTSSGANITIQINVYDEYIQTYSYSIDSMPSFYPNNEWEKDIETNIYNLNGLYVNNYSVQKNNSTNKYTVSFDAYNSNYYYGAVDIYDKDGNWIDYEEIDKFSNMSSVWDTGEQAINLISDLRTGKLLTYEQASFSKCTPGISFEVPEDGYFIISNNVATSPGTFFSNAFDILFDAAATALDLTLSDSVKDTAFDGFMDGNKKNLTERMKDVLHDNEEINETLQKVFLKSMESEIRKATKKFTKADANSLISSSNDLYSEFVTLTEDILNRLGPINGDGWKQQFKMATGIGESAFAKLSGSAGIALKGCFSLNKQLDKLLMAVQMANSTDDTCAKVFSSAEDCSINQNGVIINSSGNIDSDVVLQVFRISNNDTVEVILDSDNPLERYELYNICFIKNDQLVQPNGKVKVYLPIPNGMNGNTCKVYRQEMDGLWTILNAHIEGNYLVFETEHFSLYSIVGETENISIYSLPINTIYNTGDTLNSDGLVINVGGDLVSDGFICTPSVLSGSGTQTITVAYGYATTEFEVTVNSTKQIFSVTFNSNGGSTVEEQIVQGNERVLKPEDPVREGYRFSGWFKDSKCTVYWQFDEDVVMSNMMLYAGWIPDDELGDVLEEDIPIDSVIPAGLWVAGIKDYTYTGQPIKPEVHVYDSKIRLKEGQDYTVTYKNNTKANNASGAKNAPTVVIKGKGSYTGTETATFTIRPIDLEEPGVVTENLTVVYNSKVQKKVPIVSYKGKKLTNNKDFTVSYPDLTRGVTEAYCATGTYDILLTAKEGGNFTGTRTVKLIITKGVLLSKVTIKKIPNQPYTGFEIEPDLNVTMKNTPLVKDTDYTVTYTDNKDIGKATAILTGIGEYTGTKKVTFNIVGTSLKKAVISGIKDKVYDGSEHTLPITVTLNGTRLYEKDDYEVTYVNNLTVGKATISIRGVKAYSGTIKKTFKIKAYDIKEDTAKKIGGLQSKITCKYLKGGSKPKVELTYADIKLTEGIDYTVSYKNNKAITTVGTKKLPTITIKGKGNYKGTVVKTFTIISRALDDEEFPITLRVADKGFVDKSGNYISKPVLIDADGKKLVSGKDYESSVVYMLENGTLLTKTSKVGVGERIKAKVKGKGTYFGELEALYQIKAEDFSKAKISIAPQTYTGKEITLDKEDITVKLRGITLELGVDYDIVSESYTNNLKKGNAEVTIVGKGNYGGMKTVKFRIVSKKFEWFWRMFG